MLATKRHNHYATTQETYQSAAKEHDGNGEMFEILSSPRPTGAAQVLEEDVGSSVDENEERFRELGGNPPRFAGTNQGRGGFDVPRPTQIRETAHPSAEGQQSVPEEDAALDEMSQATKNVLATLRRKEIISTMFQSGVHSPPLTKMPAYTTPPDAIATNPRIRRVRSTAVYTMRMRVRDLRNAAMREMLRDRTLST